MLRSKLSIVAVTAALALTGRAAGAVDACLGTLDEYGADSSASIACSCGADVPDGLAFGTLIYTSDSDICTAARHAGQISGGGTVKLRGAPGCDEYPGSERNGILTETWGAWDLSFYFPGTHDGTCATQSAQQQAPTPAPAPAPAPSAAGDALPMILALLQAAPPGTFTYQDATSLGAESFEMKGVMIAPDGPGSEPISIDRLLVENLDLAGIMQGGPPSRARLTLEGMLLNDENTDIDSDFWEFLGSRSMLTNMVLDYGLDQNARTFTLNDFTFDIPGVGQATLAFDLSGVGPEALFAPEMAALQAGLKSGSLSFQDETLMSRALALGMQETGQSEDVLINIALQELSNSLAEIGAQPGDRVYQAAALLGGLLIDNKSPQGPLTVTLSPAQPVTYQQINQVDSAAQAAELVNLQASYAGSVATLPDPLVSQDYGSDAYVYTDKDVYAVGEPVIVYWDGTPGNATDWVNIVPANSPPDEWGQWAYTNGEEYGSYEFSGLQAGEYEARIFYNYPDGGFDIQASYYFTVQ